MLWSDASGILIRWSETQGHSALWLPGSDCVHATGRLRSTMLFVKRLRDKKDIVERHLERAWKWRRVWRQDYEAVPQARRFLYWRRERFLRWTRVVIRRLQSSLSGCADKGMIYKGNRLVNWCPDRTYPFRCWGWTWGWAWQVLVLPLPCKGRRRGNHWATSRPRPGYDVAIAGWSPEDDRYDFSRKTVILPIWIGDSGWWWVSRSR